MTTTELAVARWHDAVNSADPTTARRAVTDPIVVSGPQGAGPIPVGGFTDWITHSGVTLRARSWHPITDRLLVVEQEAHWPHADDWTTVATVFRATGDRVSAALRFPDLPAALAFAQLYADLAATE